MHVSKVDELLKGYRVTSPYGPRDDPFTQKPVMHTGIDLVKRHRAPIYAFVSGVVTHAKEGVKGSGYGGFGVVVAVRDDKGCTHLYAHLHSVSVKVGERVKCGDVVGYQGSTGRSTGSHLHYEVRRKGIGTHTDPVAYLREYYQSVDKPVDRGDEDTVKALEPWKLQLADKALDSLASKKDTEGKALINNAEEWKKRLRTEPQAVLEDMSWLIFVLVDRSTNTLDFLVQQEEDVDHERRV
ncbi:M23 family metallopeptidase [Brevibacillus porteri]|uniref:M23 family peptidase n=1 Tax=Brevibacillus porteri TaxID=2126350 RepID=A0ABX5FJ11_9BACL|nr:M23 family metallopeptidase [Brevibacillus porteri]MED1801766.1 M23 family metallopeptidase [Brevibacillus porteri]MED2134897.1 M23 family metallopeptidase [Brevibacillus porteri]MED2748404.1 M23 family metallopeptidase [Brevibacillus porteri]MED2818328.1 M23 family metallopeptidase [Brevibacillus porteri]MED2897713.1 M23 family metallopeptidase [Brevibacillus porteri]